MRELADYDAQIVFSAEDARAELEDAKGLADIIEAELVARGVKIPVG